MENGEETRHGVGTGTRDERTSCAGTEAPKDVRGTLIAIADDFQNDYLTIQGYAERNGLSDEHAADLLDLARRVRAAPHPES